MQLAFDFPFQEKFLPADFVVSACNDEAFKFIKNYNPSDKNLPNIFAILAPQLGGKTYLANIWQKNFNAEFLNLEELENVNLIKVIKAKKFYIIENIDEIENQELLLHIFNLSQEKSAFLLLTSTTNLSEIHSPIKDLNSRLKNTFQLKIEKPDDDLIKMLLIKNFAAKQLKVDDKVIGFLLQNLDRSFAAVHNMIRLLEFHSLEKRRGVTVPLIKEVGKKKSNN